MALDPEVETTINSVFVLICGFLCFLLQAGFGLLEVGGVREKNAQNIMLKNVMDAAVAALAYWAFGFAFAYGEGTNPFIGHSYFFLINNEDYINFFFQYVFAGTTATIVSGAVAERCRFRAYLVYSIMLSGFIYPVVCHWIWDSDGFLYGRVLDYSGSGAVHLVGGAAAMAGAWILGPRQGKFVRNPETDKLEPVEIPGHNKVLSALGTLLLWFGFFPFNAGAGYAVAGEQALIVTGRAVVVTTLAAASGAVTLLVYALWRFKCWDLSFAMNGLLGGMVATCSGVNVYDTWIAVVIGVLGAMGFYLQAWLFENVAHIDDPLNASALHMGSGIVGMLAVGFLANPRYLDGDMTKAGVCYGGTGLQLGYQVYGTVVYFAWAFGLSVIMFWCLNKVGWFRVSEEVERTGMDVHHHGGKAYNWESTDSLEGSDSTETPREKALSDDEEQQGVERSVEMDVDQQVPHASTSHHPSTMRRRSGALKSGAV